MRKCEVLVNGIEAGILIETPAGEYTFKYHKKYIDDNGQPVCLAMPLSDDEYRSKVLFPYFFNLLSEGENRRIQAALFHLDKDDDFGILLETARYDTAGAVTVKPIED